MKSRDTLIRLKRFQVEEKRRRVRQIEMMTAEFNRMIADLDREIANEEKRSGISDPTHFAYPTYARAAIGRRDNLKSSIAELSAQIEDAKAALDEALAELQKLESLDGREKGRRARRRSRPRLNAAATPSHLRPSLSAGCGRRFDKLSETRNRRALRGARRNVGSRQRREGRSRR